MKLSVINGANRIAAGFIKSAIKSKKFESILVADLYPTFESISEFHRFKHSLNLGENQSKLKETKITEKSDIVDAIENSTHTVYFTHNHYSLLPSKQSILQKTIEILKKQKSIKSTFVLPKELDHYSEADINKVIKDSESQIFDSLPDANYYRPDLTVGKYSESIFDCVYHFLANKSLLHSESKNIFHLVNGEELGENILKGLENKGDKYKVIGPDAISIQEITEKIANLAQGNHSGLQTSAFIPSSFLSEWKYSPEVRNFVNFGSSNYSHDDSALSTLTLLVAPDVGIRETVAEAKLNYQIDSNASQEKSEPIIETEGSNPKASA